MVIELSAEKRDIFGKKLKNARKEGKLPAVYYGSKEKSTPVFISAKDFKKVLKEAGETTLVSLKMGKDSKDVLIHEISFDPVKDEPIHVDFYAIEKGQKVTVTIPLEFVGVSPAVKELGGILIKVTHELEVEADPTFIPHKIEVDISSLVNFESQIAIKDLKLPEGVIATHEALDIIAAIQEAKEEEEPAPEIDLAQIEVEKKGKKEEEGGEAGALTKDSK